MWFWNGFLFILILSVLLSRIFNCVMLRVDYRCFWFISFEWLILRLLLLYRLCFLDNVIRLCLLYIIFKLFLLMSVDLSFFYRVLNKLLWANILNYNLIFFDRILLYNINVFFLINILFLN